MREWGGGIGRLELDCLKYNSIICYLLNYIIFLESIYKIGSKRIIVERK